VLGFLRRSVDEFGQTIVMVTHDPNSASYADRVLARMIAFETTQSAAGR
jgi:ABC-type lipoprotein export system ATPase subunit